METKDLEREPLMNASRRAAHLSHAHHPHHSIILEGRKFELLIKTYQDYN